MVSLGSGSARELQDLALTRYACYLIAQNGDSSKPPIAFAQTYFAVQTRKQEIVEKRLLQVDRVAAREKLTKSEKKLSSVVFERGVDRAGFATLKSKGDEALFGGFTTDQMKKKLGVPSAKKKKKELYCLLENQLKKENEISTQEILTLFIGTLLVQIISCKRTTVSPSISKLPMAMKPLANSFLAMSEKRRMPSSKN